MATRPEVSVVIPVYNGEKSLLACLNSVCDQNFQNFEVIVVDNHSTDQSRDIILKLCGKFPKVKYVFEAYRSRGAARNAGIKAAQGDVIAMTDCDCIVPHDWIKQLIRPINKEGEDIVMGHEEDAVNNFWSGRIQRGNETFIEENRTGQYITLLDTKNFACRREVLVRYMFDKHIGNLEDFDLALRVRGKIQILFLKDLRVKHLHKNTLISWFMLSVNRGFWASRIYDKHKNNDLVNLEPMFTSFKWRNMAIFPFWSVWQFFKQPFKEALYLFVSGVSWRAGMVMERFAMYTRKYNEYA